MTDDSPSTQDPPAEAPLLSIVIPAYNEALRIGGTLERIREYLERGQRTAEIVVVDDGSDDVTSHVVRGLTFDSIRVHLITGATNRGKGYSVRQGMLEATGALRLMCDADLSTPIRELDKLLGWVDEGYDVVIGSRDMPDSRLDPPQPIQRRIMARTFRALRRKLLLPDVRDTQCGFKLFRATAAEAIFSRCTIDGWLFDCEALALAEHLGYRIREVGVLWRNDPDTRVRPLQEIYGSIRTLQELRRRLDHIRSDLHDR